MGPSDVLPEKYDGSAQLDYPGDVTRCARTAARATTMTICEIVSKDIPPTAKTRGPIPGRA